MNKAGKNLIRGWQTLLYIFVIVLLAVPVSAGSSSDQYSITTSVVSAGGGPMESANYSLNSTIGQPSPLHEPSNPPAPPESTNFQNHPGFWYTLTADIGCTELAAFATAFGSLEGDSDYNQICDYDNNQNVDGYDLSVFIFNQ